MSEHEHDQRDKADARIRRANWVFVGFLAMAGFYLITEHRAHLLGWLPFAFLLLCPLMHMFMHGGHGSHGGKQENHPKDRQVGVESPPTSAESHVGHQH